LGWRSMVSCFNNPRAPRPNSTYAHIDLSDGRKQWMDCWGRSGIPRIPAPIIRWNHRTVYNSPRISMPNRNNNRDQRRYSHGHNHSHSRHHVPVKYTNYDRSNTTAAATKQSTHLVHNRHRHRSISAHPDTAHRSASPSATRAPRRANADSETAILTLGKTRVANILPHQQVDDWTTPGTRESHKSVCRDDSHVFWLPRIALIEDLTKGPLPPGSQVLVEFDTASQ